MRPSFSVGLIAALCTACGGGGGGDGGGGNPNPTSVLAKASASGDGQTATVGQALAMPFCARLTEDGAPKAGGTINWTTGGGGSLSSVATATAPDGTACSTLTLGHIAGTQAASASVQGASGSPVVFTAGAKADAAADVLKNGGDLQQGETDTQLPQPVSIKVVDQFGNPVAAVGVTWGVASGAANLNPPSGNTNAAGVVNSVVTLGSTAGPIVITATAGSLNGSPQSFNLTARAPIPPPSAITINVSNTFFQPAVDTVAVGGTVTWTWTAGSSAHDVVSTGVPGFASDPAGVSDAPHSYGPITFNTAGTYFYYCTEHGSPGNPPTGMAGRIVVK